jgi:hypothetical protein
MQSDSAPTAVAILDFVNLDVASLDQANLGKDKGNKDQDQDEDEGTGSGTGAIFARLAMTFSNQSINAIFTGIVTDICAGFWAGEASIGRVDDTVVGAIVDGVVDSTVGGGAKSSTTPITIDGLYEGDTTPTLLRKRSMTRARWR